jgi:GNAT superfamily N-acetyltransferase
LVHPERRRQGIGAQIMKELLGVTGHTCIYAEALAGTEGFPESFGIMKRSKLVACSRKPFTT